MVRGKEIRSKRKGNEWRRKKLEAKAGRPCPKNCECCGRETLLGSGCRGSGNATRLYFDHDHATGEFRGWICHACNGSLGYVRDRITHLEKLIAYLRKQLMPGEEDFCRATGIEPGFISRAIANPLPLSFGETLSIAGFSEVQKKRTGAPHQVQIQEKICLSQ